MISTIDLILIAIILILIVVIIILSKRTSKVNLSGIMSRIDTISTRVDKLANTDIPGIKSYSEKVKKAYSDYMGEINKFRQKSSIALEKLNNIDPGLNKKVVSNRRKTDG